MINEVMKSDEFDGADSTDEPVAILTPTKRDVVDPGDVVIHDLPDGHEVEPIGTKTARETKRWLKPGKVSACCLGLLIAAVAVWVGILAPPRSNESPSVASVSWKLRKEKARSARLVVSLADARQGLKHMKRSRAASAERDAKERRLERERRRKAKAAKEPSGTTGTPQPVYEAPVPTYSPPTTAAAPNAPQPTAPSSSTEAFSPQFK